MPKPVARLITVLIVAAAAVYGVDRWRSSKVSPFRLWDFSAGTDFRSMNRQATREAKRAYGCAALEAPGVGKGCSLETSGIRGSVHLLLDSADRAIVIQFRSGDTTRTMREELRKAAAQWSTIVPGRTLNYPVAGARDFQATHFATADGHWSATIAFAEGVPGDVVTLRDDRALARMHANAPLSRLAHEKLRYVNPMTEEERATLTERVMQAGRPSQADALREGAALARGARKIPACGPARTDVVASSGERAYQGPLSNESMSRAVSLAFPGAALSLDAGAYFVNPDGRAEYVLMSKTIVKQEEGLAIFGISFLRRIEGVEARLDAAEPNAAECRALAQLVVARLDQRGEVIAATALPVAGDAITSQIVDIGIVHDTFDPRKELIEVRSTSIYSTTGWNGFIQWEEWMPLVAQPRVEARAPVMVGVRRGGLTMGGQVHIDTDNLSVSEISFEIGVIAEETKAAFVRKITLPRDGGYINGWALLLLL